MLLQLYKRSFGYEGRRALSRNIDLLNVVLEKNVIYFRMPKVASDSIIKSFQGDYAYIPHSCSQLHVKILLFLKSNGFRFTFVRHPIMRFVSAYRWACREEIDPLRYPLDVPQRSAILESGDVCQFCLKLDSMIKNRKLRMVHFYPQWSWVSINNKSLLDFVGKIETLEKDVLRLRNEYDIYLDLEFGANPKNQSSNISEEWERSIDSLGLNSKALAALNLVYACDFKAFDYG